MTLTNRAIHENPIGGKATGVAGQVNPAKSLDAIVRGTRMQAKRALAS